MESGRFDRLQDFPGIFECRPRHLRFPTPGGRTMTIPESVLNLIATGPAAHLTTLNRDGSPQVTVVWVGIEGDEIVSGHLHLHHKLKNIQRDPRVAVSLQS